MATFERRTSKAGTVGYRVKVRVHGERPRSRTFKRLTDARMWASKVEADLGQGAYVPTGPDRRRTLADLIDRFNQDHPKVADHGKMRAWWREHRGYVTLDRLQPDVIVGARAELAKRKTRNGDPVTGATVNRYQAALSAVCKYAWRELRWLPSNPVLSVTKAPESAGVVRFLSDDEREALFKACRADHDPNILLAVTLALATGLRYSNIRYLQWADVDLDAATLVVERTKNGEGRRVPLIGSAVKALQDHHDADPTGAGWVFKGWRDAAPADLESSWRRVRDAAGLVGFRFHDLRHTVASYLTQSGAGLAQVADALGHKTLTMARRYSHQNPENVRATLESIADRLGGAP